MMKMLMRGLLGMMLVLKYVNSSPSGDVLLVVVDGIVLYAIKPDPCWYSST